MANLRVAPFVDDGRGSLILDSDWVRKSFMLSDDIADARFKKLTSMSSADYKFTDTRLGGNWAINQPPAFCRNADPRVSGINVENTSGDAPRGMGMYWSDAIDDNMQVIHMRFGVPEYTGLISFFSGFNDIEASLLARTGRVPITFYAGQVVGAIVGLRLLPFVLIGAMFKFLLGRTHSKYYYLRPTMHTYWNRVNFIANNIAVSMGLIQKIPTSQLELEAELEDPMSLENNSKLLEMAHLAAPRIFRKDGGVDAYYVANRVQTLALQRRNLLVDRLSKPTSAQQLQQTANRLMYEEKIRMTQNNTFDAMMTQQVNSPNGKPEPQFTDDVFNNTVKAEMEKETASALSGGATTADEANAAPPAPMNPDGSVNTQQETATTTYAEQTYVPMWDYFVKGQEGTLVKKEGWIRSLITSMQSNFNRGYEYVGFKVDATGPISASFNNQAGEPQISSDINGMSSNMASKRFTFSNGATGIPGVDQVLSGVKDFALGLAAGVDLAGLISLAGSSYVDIPDHWQSSSADLPTEQYTIPLRSPYGNKLSRFMNLMFPLAMLLAGALPISHGRQSWGQPFLCELFSVGRTIKRLAMIESLSVTHGVGNLGFNRSNEALAIDVTMNVKDMNRLFHAPIDTGFRWSAPLKGVFDDDNAFNDYISVISSTGMAELTVPTRRFAKNVNLRLAQLDSFWSTSNLTMAVADTQPARFVKALAGLTAVTAPMNTRVVS